MNKNALPKFHSVHLRRLRGLSRLLSFLSLLGLTTATTATWGQTARDIQNTQHVQSTQNASGQETPAPEAAPQAKTDSTSTPDTREARLPKQALTPKVLYQTVLAEIAGQRGHLALASKLYMELLRQTQDPRIAARATEVALYARQSEQALEAVQVWVAAEPDSASAHQAAAGLFLGAGRIDEAMKHLKTLLTIKPSPLSGERAPEEVGSVPDLSPDILPVLRLEQIQRVLARYPDKAVARSMLERLSQPYENLPEVQFIRARAAAEARDDVAALASVERALKLRPEWEQAVLFKAQIEQRASSTQAETTLKNYLDAHPDAKEVRLAYARSLIGGKQYDAARQAFSILLKQTPDNVEVLYAVALLSIQLDDLPAAERHLKRLLELGAGNANLFRYYLGQVAEAAKRPEEALDWYQKVAPGEQYLPAMSRAANLLARQGQLDQGRALLQKSAQENVQERIPLLIAESQLLINAKRIKDAYHLLDGHLRLQPDQPELLYETALLAERIHQFDVMERHLRHLIRIKPDDAHAYNALGYSLVDRGLRLEEAGTLIEKALALSPEDPFIMDSKGWLLFRRGDRQGALDILRKAHERRPDPEIAAHLGEVLWVMGQQDAARKMWQDAARKNVDNELLDKTMSRFLGNETPKKSAVPVQVPPAPSTATAR